MVSKNDPIERILNRLTLREKASLLSGEDSWRTVAIERLGIPSITMTDGPHGVRATRMQGRITGPATAFPTGVSMAASWDPVLVEQVARALGAETRAMGCEVLLGPCVNIQRTPLAGRNFEAYAEDPFLAGQIGAAWVMGVQSQGVAASLKHFACNNQEFERFRGSSVVDERSLREIYLPAFEHIVKNARPWTVMCAYNRVNGVHASQNPTLLTEILRDEWGFDGLVVSDWNAVHTIVEAVAAGLDLEMPGPAKYFGPLLAEAVLYWQLDEAVVDRAAGRVLQLIGRVGRLPGIAQGNEPGPGGQVNTPAHQALARRLASEAVVLLKNEGGLLPLDPAGLKSLAVIGPNAAEARLGGGGSAYVEPPYQVSPLQGLRDALGSAVEIRYEAGCDNYYDPPAIETIFLRPAQGGAQGLWGEYFDNPDLAGQPKLSRLDPQIDFRWSHNPPGEGIPRSRFSARWTGKLVGPADGRFVLSLLNSAAAQLYLDGRLLLDHQVPFEKLQYELPDLLATAEVTLEQGREYDLRIEYCKLFDERNSSVRLGLMRSPADQADRIARAAEAAGKCSAAILFAGLPERYETEGRDRVDWTLPGPQAELIEAVLRANPRTVVVLNCGAPVALPWIDAVPAVVQAFYPGMEGGHALADLLLGRLNPSGKLPFTFPRRYEDNPTFLNYPGGREVRYGEGIFVGYRYYDHSGVEPLFPFGHGLSYTSFKYEDLEIPPIARVGQPVRVTCKITNHGRLAGKEVVQLYVRDPISTLPRPPKELKAFRKIALDPGEMKQAEFILEERAFSYYDPVQKSWVCEPGRFEILVGSSSRDIRLRGEIELGNQE